MSRLTKFHRLLCGAACVVALCACSTTAPVKPSPAVKPSLDQVLGQATEASRAGQKEQALKLLQQASTDYPTDKAPWLQKAQIRFEGGQYGEAILDAQQALKRDPTDKVANSIVAISGLRLSTTALADLARQNNLTGSLRSESQDLAKLLRESIGEAVLVPPVKARPAAPSTARGGRKAPAVKDAGDGASPFDALK
jgi:tetratricopeptide (TPR) repeat protein